MSVSEVLHRYSWSAVLQSGLRNSLGIRARLCSPMLAAVSQFPDYRIAEELLTHKTYSNLTLVAGISAFWRLFDLENWEVYAIARFRRCFNSVSQRGWRSAQDQDGRRCLEIAWVSISEPNHGLLKLGFQGAQNWLSRVDRDQLPYCLRERSVRVDADALKLHE